VPTYIMLCTLTPEGVTTIKNNPQRIREVNREVEQLGATVKAQWAVLGEVDFISVVEAPDETTMARVSMELGSRGTARYETRAIVFSSGASTTFTKSYWPSTAHWAVTVTPSCSISLLTSRMR
jgi:uncharacterized protein with GYD domain